MEYKRISNRRCINIYRIMLKGDRMCCKTDACFVDGAQWGGLVDRPSSRLMPWSFIADYFRAAGPTLTSEDMQERIDRTFGLSQDRYRPAKIKTIKVALKADCRYYKLFDGNILDLQTKTILIRSGLLKMMEL